MSGTDRVCRLSLDNGSVLMKTVMDRDFRLTGVFRGQTDNVEAPLGFEVNNPWKVCLSPTNYCLAASSDDPRWRIGFRDCHLSPDLIEP